MNKYVLFGAVIVALICFMFFTDSYPSEIEFQGVILGSKEDVNDTVDKEVDLISYRDKPNHHILIFGIMNNSVRTLDSLTSLYLSNFKSQGFDFQSNGTRYLGTKKGESIYMTELNGIEGIVIYIEKSAEDRSSSDEASIFTDLEYISL